MQYLNKKVIIFDLCGTLYSSNTTFDFIKYYHRKKRNCFMYFFIIILTSVLGKILSRLKIISTRKLILKTLSDSRMDDLRCVAVSFYDDYLSFCENISAFELFDDYLDKEQTTVVIVSASIDPVVEVVAKRKGVSFRSSYLEVKNGLVTGNLSLDLKGNKHTLGFKNVDCVITDNLDDYIVCSLSKRAEIFSKRKNLSRWKIIAMKEFKETSYDIHLL